MPETGAERVADDLWTRVRELAARVEDMSEGAALDELDADGQARLDRLRVRLLRAARRAELADQVADELAEVGTRARRPRPNG